MIGRVNSVAVTTYLFFKNLPINCPTPKANAHLASNLRGSIYLCF